VALVREYLANHYQALAKVELARGRLAESVAAASQLRPLMAGNPQRLYQAASAIARCVAALDARKDPPADAGQRQMWIDLAVQLLRDAVAGGLKDPGQLRTDPQLSALRDDAGFKQLLENH